MKKLRKSFFNLFVSHSEDLYLLKNLAVSENIEFLSILEFTV